MFSFKIVVAMDVATWLAAALDEYAIVVLCSVGGLSVVLSFFYEKEDILDSFPV
jgi:hypothetical protein